MGLFKKKKEDNEDIISELSGISIKKPIIKNKPPEITNCIIKGIAEFMIVFGSLGGFMSAFDVEYNPIIVGVLFLIGALYLSSLFAFEKNWKKDVGYIIFFVVYVLGLFSLRSYVNSGFSVALNDVRSHFEVFFNMDSGNEFSELVDDRYLAATVMIIFVGTFEILLLNIFISNYMSFKTTAFVALFIYIFPLYIREEPNIAMVLCMIFGLMLVYLMKNGQHFQNVKNNPEFVKVEKKPGWIRRLSNRIEKKEETPGEVKVEYSQNPYVFAGIGLFSMICIVVAIMFNIMFGAEDYRKYYTENAYKTATRDTVSAVVLLGLRGLSPWGYSVGGMSGGNFRNVSAIRPMGRTHMKVTYAPYSYMPIYLKGYTGLEYMQGRWISGYELTGATFGSSPYFVVESMANEAAKLEDEFNYSVYGKTKGEGKGKAKSGVKPKVDGKVKTGVETKVDGKIMPSITDKLPVSTSAPQKNEKAAKAKMEIINVEANQEYAYYPYFTVFDDYNYYIDHKFGDEYTTDLGGKKLFLPSETGKKNKKTLTFYPNIDYNSKVTDMDSYIYKQVPEINRASVDKFIENAGITADDPDKVSKVVNYFKQNYKYSYNPGRVPNDQEFINYFLDENKRGVCYHFASACVLVLRRLGVSARYVEGYAFSYEQATQGKIREDLKFEDYYEGYSAIGKTAVMEVTVTDSNAHAWVEVYNPEKGWIVVDPTPANALEGETGDFWGAISKVLNDNSGTSLDGVIPKLNLEFFTSNGMKIAVLMIIGILVMFWLVRVIIRKRRLYAMLNTDDYKLNLIRNFRVLDEKKSKRDEEFAALSMPAAKIRYLYKKKQDKKGNAFVCEDFIEMLERACFAPGRLEECEYKKILENLKVLFK